MRGGTEECETSSSLPADARIMGDRNANTGRRDESRNQGANHAAWERKERSLTSGKEWRAPLQQQPA